jgi:type IX secretion system PorP/SprF family membrane protein
VKIFISVFFSVILFNQALICEAQDASFSQYYASSLYLNPAFAGIEPSLTINGNSRTQWKSIVTPYVTNQLSFIVPIVQKGIKQRHYGGVGFSIFNQKAGDGKFQTLGANINIGYNLKLSSLHHVSFGAQGGFVQKSIQLNKLQWGSQYDQFIGGYNQSIPVDINDISSSTSFIDFAGGIMYYYNPARDYEEHGFSMYGGIASYHLTKPNESMVVNTVNNIPLLLKAHGGFEVNISKKLNFSPNVYIAMQNKLKQINTGAYLTFLFGDKHAKAVPSFILLGGWYRFKDSYIASLGIGNSVYTLGFSYDLNNTSLRYNTQGKGAYEISLKVQKPSASKKVRIYNPMI